MRKLSCILIAVVVPWKNSFIRTHGTVRVTSVNFIACNLYLSELINEKRVGGRQAGRLVCHAQGRLHLEGSESPWKAGLCFRKMLRQQQGGRLTFRTTVSSSGAV